jgi:DNA-binding HxlR family transcriptional regulator
MDSWEGRILYYLRTDEKMTWNELKHSIEKDIGTLNPNLLHFYLKKLKEKNKVRFINIGDIIFYQKV